MGYSHPKCLKDTNYYLRTKFVIALLDKYLNKLKSVFTTIEVRFAPFPILICYVQDFFFNQIRFIPTEAVGTCKEKTRFSVCDPKCSFSHTILSVDSHKSHPFPATLNYTFYLKRRDYLYFCYKNQKS